MELGHVSEKSSVNQAKRVGVHTCETESYTSTQPTTLITFPPAAPTQCPCSKMRGAPKYV